MSFDLTQIAVLVSIGLVAGTVGGMLGVGGSIIMIPAMQIVLHRSQHLYQAAAMIVNVVVAAPAAWRHYRNGVVLTPVIRWLIPAAIIGVLLGVAASNAQIFSGANTVNLSRAFALFLAYVIAYNAYRLVVPGKPLPSMDAEAARRLPPWSTASVGFAMGFFGGLLGIGGGALAVPAQQIILRIPLRNAIGNSACTMVLSALLGAVFKNATLSQHEGAQLAHSLAIAAWLTPSAFLGGYVGAQLTHRLPLAPVRLVFALMMAAAAWRMWHAKPPAATRPSDNRAKAAAPADPSGHSARPDRQAERAGHPPIASPRAGRLEKTTSPAQADDVIWTRREPLFVG